MDLVATNCTDCGHAPEDHHSDFRGTKVSACVNGCDCQQYVEPEHESGCQCKDCLDFAAYCDGFNARWAARKEQRQHVEQEAPVTWCGMAEVAS